MKTRTLKYRILGTILLLGHCLSQPLQADPGAPLREAAAAKAKESPVVQGSDGWLFLPAELRHIGVGRFWGPDAAAVSKAARPESADPVPAILDFQQQLKSAGIRLIMVPVPAKAFVYPEAVTGGDLSAPPGPRTDTYHQEFYQALRDQGVEVLDLLPDLLSRRNQDGNLMACKQDSHWSGAATVLAAEKIAGMIKDTAWPESAPRVQTSVQNRKVEVNGDLRGMLESSKPSPESLDLRFVTDQATGALVEPSAQSPIVLLGDSHNLVFHAGDDMLAKGAGLPDQLAHELGMPVDLIAVRGSGATPARVNMMRRVKADPSYLNNKKVVVWCFTVRELTESTGWQKVPVVPKK
jgi:hypothetical protein